MRQPEDLSHAELLALVRELRDLLYTVTTEHGVVSLAPDQEWDSDTLAELGELLDRYGLAPEPATNP